MATLLALGSAALSTSTVSAKGETAAPSALATTPPLSTSSGCTNSLTSATGRNSRSGVRLCACCCARHSTAPMVNSATGVAESPSMRTISFTGPGKGSDVAATIAPSAIAQGSGLLSAPRSARPKGASTPCCVAVSLAGRSCARARHSELVKTMSMRMQPISGPAVFSPSRPISSGKPMKPEFGKAATSAPKAASFMLTPGPPGVKRSVMAMVNSTISAAPPPQIAISTGSISCAKGMLAPKRNSMQGRAKNSTKPFRPGIADSGR